MTRFTEERLAERIRKAAKDAPVAKKAKQPKYRNKKVTVDGVVFDSIGESVRWRELQMLERAGEITNLERQVVFKLAAGVILYGRKKPPLKFTADYAYWQNGQRVVEDFKSPATAKETAFRMRLHLMMSVWGIEVQLRGK